MAVFSNDMTVFKHLLSVGQFSSGRIRVLLQTQDKSGRNPLHIAAYKVRGRLPVSPPLPSCRLIPRPSTAFHGLPRLSLRPRLRDPTAHTELCHRPAFHGLPRP